MNKTLRLSSLRVSTHLRSFRLFLLTLSLCGLMQTRAETWTDGNGFTWSFTVNGTEATDIRPAMVETRYIYGDPANPEQGPVTLEPGDAAAGRFSYTEGKYFPTIPGDVYFGIKTLIFDIIDAQEGSHIWSDATDVGCTIRVMNGWWSTNYADDVPMSVGLWELPITEQMARECAPSDDGGEGKDLDLLMTRGSITIKSVYYQNPSFSETELVIPEKVYVGSMELTVTSIGAGAFSGCPGLTSVTIPASVTSIGAGAFFGCTGLTSVTINSDAIMSQDYSWDYSLVRIFGPQVKSVIIGEGVTRIGNFAFIYCSGLTSVTIPESVTSIGDRAFDGCTGLTSVTIPEGVTSIGDYAFSYCSSLTSVTIPSSVTNIGAYAFYNCPSLISVISLIEEPFEIGFDVFYDWNNETGQSGFTTATLYVPAGTKEKYEATPAWNQFQNIVELEDKNIQFVDAAVKAICVANWDTNGDEELSYVEAAAVADLGEVFKENSEITSFDELQYFTGLTSIADNAFYNLSNLTSVTIPKGVTNIGAFAFFNCSGLTSMTIPEGVTSIGWGAFSKCSGLTNVTIPGSVMSIASQAFLSCSGLTSVTIAEGVTSIGDQAFYNCSSMTSVTIPSSVTNIGSFAFYGCSGLMSATMHEGLTIIDNYAFSGCSSLTSMIIPSSVTSIGDWAFYGCSSLTSMTIPEGFTSIGMGVFSGCSSLTSVTIPEGVTSIGYAAFDGCAGLTSVTIPSSVTKIDPFAFERCSGLASVTIPSSVTSIGESAFRGCSSLKNITVDESNNTYDSRNNCNAIIETATNTLIVGCQNTVIPKGVISIGNYAFEGCSGLTGITIPEGVTSIGDDAFYNCSGLTSVTIPLSVTSIGEGVFFGCTSLISVTSLIAEPFEIGSDVFRIWNEETGRYEFTSATLYVPAGTKEKYLATPAWNQFLNIVEMGLEPVEQGETVDFGTDISEDTNIDGNTVGDIYYSISSGDGSYDPSEGCIVVTSPTDDETVSGVSGTDIFGEDFNAHFTGVVFKVAPGKGTIRVEAQTTGNMVLKVKIGDGEPITMELEGKLKVSFPYNVGEETYVYIYGSENSAAANGMRFAPSTGSLKIYGIEVESVTDGIETATLADGDDDAPIYNLNGQRVNTPHRGVYIQNGKKVLVK